MNGYKNFKNNIKYGFLEVIDNVKDIFTKGKKSLTDPVEILDDNQKYLIDKIILKNKLNIIVGDMFSGKTNFVLLLLNALANGETFFNFKVNFEGGNIFYFDGENGFATIKERWLKIIKGETASNVYIISQNDFNYHLDLSDDIQTNILGEQLKSENAKLVIFDPLISFTYGSKENEAGFIRKITSNLRNYLCQKGITVIAVHHFSKPQKESEEEWLSFHRIRGSSDIAASFDMIWGCIKPNIEKLDFFIQCLKNRLDVPLSKSMLIKYDEEIGFMLDTKHAIEDTKKFRFIDSLMSSLEDSEDGIDSTEIERLAQEAKISTNFKWKILKELREKNVIYATKIRNRTIYKLVPQVEIQSEIN
ncbi:MAG: AAA family ATPase [Patescibacteria group bacterium]|nr:AAA family ATPase [Patescibacteria group bacterium]